MRRRPGVPEKSTPPGVPISVNVRPAPETLVAAGDVPLPMEVLTKTT